MSTHQNHGGMAERDAAIGRHAARPFKHILVPSDFSRPSERSYVVANRLAEAFGGTVDLLHVIPTLTYFRESIKTLGIPFDMEDDIYPRIQKESEHRLREMMADYIHEGRRGDVHVAIDRKVSDRIASFGLENRYDLIVIGARGSDATSLIRGSTSEGVIRRSRVPVLTVGDAFEWAAVKRILVPTDGSDESLEALDAALDLAGSFGGSIRMLYVLELHGIGDVAGMQGLMTERGDPMEAARRAVVERLAVRYPDTVVAGSTGGWVFRDGRDATGVPGAAGAPGHAQDGAGGAGSAAGASDVKLDLDIVRGVSAHYEIEREAEASADLVVMSTHGHSGLAHLVMGSTAEKVASRLRKPVLTIRPESVG